MCLFIDVLLMHHIYTDACTFSDLGATRGFIWKVFHPFGWRSPRSTWQKHRTASLAVAVIHGERNVNSFSVRGQWTVWVIFYIDGSLISAFLCDTKITNQSTKVINLIKNWSWTFKKSKPFITDHFDVCEGHMCAEAGDQSPCVINRLSACLSRHSLHEEVLISWGQRLYQHIHCPRKMSYAKR